MNPAPPRRVFSNSGSRDSACLRAVLGALIALTLSTAPTGLATSQTVPPGFDIQPILALGNPVNIAFLPDGRTLVTDRYNSQVVMIKNDVRIFPEVIDFHGNNCSERGLLGIAVDPHFAQNGWVYVFLSLSSKPYDISERDSIVDNRIIRFTMDGDFAVPGSAILLRSLPTIKTSCQHVGGILEFAPDDTLLVTYGDSANEPNPNPALWLNDLRGKILRLNPANGQAAPGNLFARDGDGNTAPEIFAYGSRNPFGLTVHPWSGRIFTTENSNFVEDEVNRVEEGGNYGWPMVEGFDDLPAEQAYTATQTNYRNPIWTSGPETICPTGIEAVARSHWTSALGNGLLFGQCNTPWQIQVLPLTPNGNAAGPPVPFATDFPGPVIDVAFDELDRLWVVTFPTIYRITKQPVIDAGPPGPRSGLALAHAGAHPRPGGASLRLTGLAGADAQLDIRNVAGQVVQSLAAESRGEDAVVVHWDGRDRAGRKVAPGVYFVSVSGPGERKSLPIVLID